MAIPSDATNGGRALKLLESAGLLKMDPEVGYLGTKADIVENPLNLDIYEVEAAQTPSLLPDVAIAVINGGHAVDAGLIPAQDAIFLESTDSSETENNPFINVIVARTADKDNEVYKKVVDTYHTDAVAKAMAEIGTVSGVHDDLPGGAVHRRAGGAGFRCGNTGQLSL